MTPEERDKLLPEESMVIDDDDDMQDEAIKKLPMNHISGIMEYLHRQNHKSDSSIYDDIKSRSKLPSIVLDAQIKPDIFSKVVTNGIKSNQQIRQEEIISLHGIRHSMSELFSESMRLDKTYMAIKENPLQI